MRQASGCIRRLQSYTPRRQCALPVTQRDHSIQNEEGQMSSTRSKVLQRAAIVVLAAVGAALPQIVTAQSDALLGKWILVPERSKVLRSGALQEHDADLLQGGKRHDEATSTASMPKATPIKGTVEVVDDNKSRPATGLPDYDSAKWQKLNDNQALFMYERRRNTVAIGTRTLGNGGKSLTLQRAPGRQQGQAGESVRPLLHQGRRRSRQPRASAGLRSTAARAGRGAASAAEQLARRGRRRRGARGRKR